MSFYKTDMKNRRTDMTEAPSYMSFSERNLIFARKMMIDAWKVMIVDLTVEARHTQELFMAPPVVAWGVGGY